MLVLKNVFLSYTKEYFTLNDVSLTVNNGEKVVLFGEKESGKSSLIRVIAGLEQPSLGEVLIKSININKINFATDVALGYIGGFGAFFNNKTVKQNLAYVLKIRKQKKEIINSKVKGALLVHDLDRIKDAKIKSLSEYDKMRVAIARLSLRPIELLVCDDIFESFNDAEATSLAALINELIHANSGITSIVATSNPNLVKVFKGRKITLKYGGITEKGSSKNESVKR